jgi:hypothetical protein
MSYLFRCIFSYLIFFLPTPTPLTPHSFTRSIRMQTKTLKKNAICIIMLHVLLFNNKRRREEKKN